MRDGDPPEPSTPPRRRPARRRFAILPLVVSGAGAMAGPAAWPAMRAEAAASARETARVAPRRDLHRARAAAMAARTVDVDGDGAGEALSFRELAGLAPPRTSAAGVPAWDAAFARGAAGGWDASLALDAPGNDGRVRRPVGAASPGRRP